MPGDDEDNQDDRNIDLNDDQKHDDDQHSLEDGILKTRRRRKEQPGQVELLSTLPFLQIPIALASRPEHNVFVAAKLYYDKKRKTTTIIANPKQRSEPELLLEEVCEPLKTGGICEQRVKVLRPTCCTARTLVVIVMIIEVRMARW